MKGKLYLIPSFLGDENPLNMFPSVNATIVKDLKHFIVEEERTARRFLKKLVPEIVIDNLHFNVLNEHTKPEEIGSYLNACNEFNVGLLSEAGVPCVADPGALIVALAHKMNIEVVPLIGPSSILMALMASGLNGQSFAFNGYLPVQHNERVNRIKFFEKRSNIENQTQIFIEAPYRNMPLFEDIISTCSPNTLMCVASDLTLDTQFIKTMRIEDWKKNKPDLKKHPAIFLINSR
jgi:16S rRNA (cytidine1402-2'-O)-methyltransferase